MPNWVEQDLHVAGPKPEIDRFIRAGLRRGRGTVLDNDELLFTRLCPLRRSEPKDTYTHAAGDILTRCRTRTEAFFAVRTTWDYPAAFYARLPRFWPQLTFFCSVNEDMGQCGGIIVVIDGELHNLVRDYDASYNVRQHRGEVRSVLKRLTARFLEERPWRLMPREAWEQRYMPFDAWFDDDWWFYFRTRDEMSAFGARYRSRFPMRFERGAWRRTALRRPERARS